MADAATTSDSVPDGHRHPRHVVWLLFLLLSVGTLSIPFQFRFGTVG